MVEAVFGGTEEEPVVSSETESRQGTPPGGGDVPAPARPARSRHGRHGSSWWQRDHPMFAMYAGFYTGLLMALLVPAAGGALLAWFFDRDRAEQLVPLLLVPFAVPLALLVPARTRRFAAYMWIGIVSTGVVVVVVAAAVLWFMLRQRG